MTWVFPQQGLTWGRLQLTLLVCLCNLLDQAKVIHINWLCSTSTVKSQIMSPEQKETCKNTVGQRNLSPASSLPGKLYCTPGNLPAANCEFAGPKEVILDPITDINRKYIFFRWRSRLLWQEVLQSSEESGHWVWVCVYLSMWGYSIEYNRIYNLFYYVYSLVIYFLTNSWQNTGSGCGLSGWKH